VPDRGRTLPRSVRKGILQPLFQKGIADLKATDKLNVSETILLLN
jgi:hypothetical protein